jgi:hypothetical protein
MSTDEDPNRFLRYLYPSARYAYQDPNQPAIDDNGALYINQETAPDCTVPGQLEAFGGQIDLNPAHQTYSTSALPLKVSNKSWVLSVCSLTQEEADPTRDGELLEISYASRLVPIQRLKFVCRIKWTERLKILRIHAFKWAQ